MARGPTAYVATIDRRSTVLSAPLARVVLGEATDWRALGVGLIAAGTHVLIR